MEDFYCDEVLSGRTPVNVVKETAAVLAYHTRPFWPVHIVVIPKRHVPSLIDFGDLGESGEELLTELLAVVREIAADVSAEHGAARVLTNLGEYQDSKHLHFHVNFGEPRKPGSLHPVDTFEVQLALDRFSLEGEFIDVRPLTKGHIHNTFVSKWKVADGTRQYIHQRMNRKVFPDLEVLMHNISRISDHMAAKLGGLEADGFEPLRLIPARNGRQFVEIESGAWRTFDFIENTSSFDQCSSPDQAFEAGRAFGWFQAQLRDLPAGELGETLPDFFSSPVRYEQFRTALAGASEERKALAKEWIEFAEARTGMVSLIEDRLNSGAIPTRIVHGDTKLNNILFDNDTGKAKGIVDLDTCMAGYSLYDFGDLVRFTAAKSAEDETDLSKVGTDLELYRALADGYLSTARGFLLEEEIELMPFAARLVTFTIGLRFLADHLAGDVYFQVHRPHQNLDRARVQFGMVRFMEEHEAEMTIR